MPHTVDADAVFAAHKTLLQHKATDLGRDLVIESKPLHGLYTSRLVGKPGSDDKPEPVLMMATEDHGWWFFLPETWPVAEWRNTCRWFQMDLARFDAE